MFFLDINSKKGFVCNRCWSLWCDNNVLWVAKQVVLYNFMPTYSDQPMQSLASRKGNLVNLICDFVVIITREIHKDTNGTKQKPKHSFVTCTTSKM